MQNQYAFFHNKAELGEHSKSGLQSGVTECVRQVSLAPGVLVLERATKLEEAVLIACSEGYEASKYIATAIEKSPLKSLVQ